MFGPDNVAATAHTPGKRLARCWATSDDEEDAKRAAAGRLRAPRRGSAPTTPLGHVLAHLHHDGAPRQVPARPVGADRGRRAARAGGAVRAARALAGVRAVQPGHGVRREPHSASGIRKNLGLHRERWAPSACSTASRISWRSGTRGSRRSRSFCSVARRRLLQRAYESAGADGLCRQARPHERAGRPAERVVPAPAMATADGVGVDPAAVRAAEHRALPRLLRVARRRAPANGCAARRPRSSRTRAPASTARVTSTAAATVACDRRRRGRPRDRARERAQRPRAAPPCIRHRRRDAHLQFLRNGDPAASMASRLAGGTVGAARLLVVGGGLALAAPGGDRGPSPPARASCCARGSR